MRSRCSGAERSRVKSGGLSDAAGSPRAARSALSQNMARVCASVAPARRSTSESASCDVPGIP